jgi:hypothetical protein
MDRHANQTEVSATTTETINTTSAATVMTDNGSFATNYCLSWYADHAPDQPYR